MTLNMPRRVAPDRPELVNQVRRAMKRARVESDLSMEDFAAALSDELGSRVDRSRISEWEAGEKTPRATVLVAAARVAGVPVSALLGSLVADEIDRTNLEGGASGLHG